MIMKNSLSRLKNILFILFVFTTMFICVDGVKADCNDGIVCSYKFCGLRDTANPDKNGGLAIGGCAENNNYVYMDVIFTCADTSKNAKDCDSFVSWAYGYKNYDGKSCNKLNSWGNYDDVFHNTDKYFKRLFNKNGEFTCPTLIVGLNGGTSDDVYKIGYGKPSGLVFNQSSQEGVENTINWQGVYSAGAKITASNYACANSNTNFDTVEAQTKKECDDTVIDKVEEEIEHFEEQTGNNQGEVNTQAIIEWANNHGYGNSIQQLGDDCDLINPELKDMLSIGFWIISIVGIILLVTMTAISFIKAIVGSDDEKLKDAFKHLVTRIIVVIILLLLPIILNFIITLINENIEGTVQIGSGDNVFCGVASGSSSSSSDDDSGTAVIDEDTGEMTQ